MHSQLLHIRNLFLKIMYSSVLFVLQVVCCFNIKPLIASSALPAAQIKAFIPSHPHLNLEHNIPALVRPSFARIHSPLVGTAERSSAHINPLSAEASVIKHINPILAETAVLKHANPVSTENNAYSVSRKGYDPVRSARGAPQNVVARYNPNTATQTVGSCHMFAVSQVLYNTIKQITGREISIGSMFADHLTAPFIGPIGLKDDIYTKVLQTHLANIKLQKTEAVAKEIKSIKRARGTGGIRAALKAREKVPVKPSGTGPAKQPNPICDTFSNEGGSFIADLALLEMFGAALVQNSKSEMKFVEDASKGVTVARSELLKEDPHPAAKRVIEKSIERILSKSVHVSNNLM
jgi:hypothetical protein